MIEYVVEKYHAAGFDLVRQPVGHPIGVMIEPVVGVQIPGDDLVAEPQGIEAGRYALMTIRRAEQPLPIRGDGLLAGAELCPPFFSRN